MTGPQNVGFRIPIDSNGLQVNFCKNPVCPNFGRPADVERQPRGFQQASSQDVYIVAGASDNLHIKCRRCGESPPIKNNLAIREEIERMSDYLKPDQEPTCPNTSCDNRLIGISTPKAYQSFGKTRSGSQRYRCRLCNTTFSVSSNPSS